MLIRFDEICQWYCILIVKICAIKLVKVQELWKYYIIKNVHWPR